MHALKIWAAASIWLITGRTTTFTARTCFLPNRGRPYTVDGRLQIACTIVLPLSRQAFFVMTPLKVASVALLIDVLAELLVMIVNFSLMLYIVVQNMRCDRNDYFDRFHTAIDKLSPDNV